MNVFLCSRPAMRYRLSLLVCSVAIVGMPSRVDAICGLDGAVREQLRSVDDPEAVRALDRRIALQSTCSVCHLARRGGPRNEYGSGINTLLSIRDREDPGRQRDAGRRMREIVAHPLVADSPTFDELFQQGRFPAESLAGHDPALPRVPARVSEQVTVEQARELVRQTEAESPFGILQLSRTREITPAVAEALAEFRGEMLILGIQSLPPEVARALADSQAAVIWLHSITSVSEPAATTIAGLPGQLVLTSLAKLDSVPLANKLASRPGALSFPYLTLLTPEIAAALARTSRSLTLAGLTDVSLDVQEKLAETVGTLSLPNLTTLASLPLANKLRAAVVLLSKVRTLTAEQTKSLIGERAQSSFWGGIYLSTIAVTPDVARVLAANPKSVELTLVGDGAIADAVLQTLLTSRLSLTLRDAKELTPEQIGIVAETLTDTTFRPGVLGVARLSLPALEKLDSALLAETLVKSTGFNFPAVTEISPEAAAALGSLPEEIVIGADGTIEIRPNGELNFPSLETLTPEIAELLLSKRWLSISLPAVQEVSLETMGRLARQTFRLTLGISELPSNVADGFEEISTDLTMGGGFIVFPNLTNLSPKAARFLVQSLNRGVQDLGFTRLSGSPKLYFGGDFAFPAGGFPVLAPAVAAELAKYDGTLAIQGLGELPAESAAALACFQGPYLILSGPGVEKLSPDAAASLAQVPGVLQIQLRELDSVPLAQRFARQINWTLTNLETVSKDAAAALSLYRQFLNLRALTVLDSAELARRLVADGSAGGITLPALSKLTPEAAEILAAGSKPLYLGLTVLDSPAVARALARSKPVVRLPRLRAVTPDVVAVLKEATSIETPPLESLYVLPEISARR